MKWKKWLCLCGLSYVCVCCWGIYSALEEAEAVNEIVQIEEKPKIALTFDDGPSIYTQTLLNGLKERGVKATFFVIGKNVENYPEVVQRASGEGHLIGNHTYSHVDINRISNGVAREEINKTNTILEELLDKPIEYVRPPFGNWQKQLEKEIGMVSVAWTIDPLDWTTENIDEIVNKVVTEAGENDIILLHDCYESSVEAALQIVDLLQAAGFEFVTVDELLLP